jgi:hypothetical protein
MSNPRNNPELGSLSILLAGYLALAVALVLGLGTTGLSLIAQHRVQGVADAAVLFAHDFSVRKGIPNPQRLEQGAERFLSLAPAARRLEITAVRTFVSSGASNLELCALYRDPFLMFSPGVICANAKAKSFLVP